jgi:hypothetical protein
MKTANEYPDPMCAFLHHLRDTVILLNGDLNLANMVQSAQDGVTEAMVDSLRKYNIALFTNTKDRLEHLNKIKLIAGPEL